MSLQIEIIWKRVGFKHVTGGNVLEGQNLSVQTLWRVKCLILLSKSPGRLIILLGGKTMQDFSFWGHSPVDQTGTSPGLTTVTTPASWKVTI